MVDAFLTVQSGNAFIRVPLESIRYVESRRHYLVIRACSGTFRIRGKISEYAERLSHADFVQVHRCYVVNMRHIEVVRTNEVVFSDGERLPIGRRYRNAVQALR